MQRKHNSGGSNVDGEAGLDEALLTAQRGELAAQLEILSAIGASSRDFIYVFDLNHRFIYASPPLLKLWGRTLDSVVGRNFAELGYPTDLVELHRGQIDEALTGKTVSGANAYVKPNSAQGHYEYTFVPVAGRDGRVKCVVGTTRDVSEKVRLERERAAALSALHESEVQLRHFADSIPQLAWMARADGHIFWYNRRWYEYTGTTWEDMQGWGWQRVHDPVTLPKVLEQWKASLATGNPFEMAFPIKSQEGPFRLFLTRVLPIRDASGAVLSWFGTNTDIEAQHQALAQRDEALASANQAARTKDEFLAMLGHELRNPLAPIVTALKLLQMRGAFSREYEVIDRQVKHLARLVDDLLDVARITQGTIKLRSSRMDARSAIHQGLEMASPLIEERAQQIKLELPSDELPVLADSHRLEQMFANLLSNASKFSPPGSEIFLRAEQVGDTVQVKIRDQGVGIPSDMLTRIFDSFVQQPQSIERAGGGLGIGLTIVKTLAQLHGGSVHATSAGEGTGAEFVVQLPRLATTTATPAVENGGSLTDAPLASKPERGRVLIVDDNKDAAQLLSEFVSSLGLEVEVAFDPPAALAIAVQFRPHIALLDIGLPVMDGWELGRRLRALLGSQQLKLIAVTGYGQERDKLASSENGFAAHLVKPIDLDMVTRLVCS